MVELELFGLSLGRRLLTVEAQLGLMTRLQMTGRRETGSDGIGRQDESVSTNKRAKSAKGAIKIESDKGWLRLRFSHLGKPMLLP